MQPDPRATPPAVPDRLEPVVKAISGAVAIIDELPPGTPDRDAILALVREAQDALARRVAAASCAAPANCLPLRPAAWVLAQAAEVVFERKWITPAAPPMLPAGQDQAGMLEAMQQAAAAIKSALQTGAPVALPVRRLMNVCQAGAGAVWSELLSACSVYDGETAVQTHAV